MYNLDIPHDNDVALFQVKYFVKSIKYTFKVLS